MSSSSSTTPTPTPTATPSSSSESIESTNSDQLQSSSSFSDSITTSSSTSNISAAASSSTTTMSYQDFPDPAAVLKLMKNTNSVAAGYVEHATEYLISTNKSRKKKAAPTPAEILKLIQNTNDTAAGYAERAIAYLINTKKELKREASQMVEAKPRSRSSKKLKISPVAGERRSQRKRQVEVVDLAGQEEREKEEAASRIARRKELEKIKWRYGMGLRYPSLRKKKRAKLVKYMNMDKVNQYLFKEVKVVLLEMYPQPTPPAPNVVEIEESNNEVIIPDDNFELSELGHHLISKQTPSYSATISTSTKSSSEVVTTSEVGDEGPPCVISFVEMNKIRKEEVDKVEGVDNVHMKEVDTDVGVAELLQIALKQKPTPDAPSKYKKAVVAVGNVEKSELASQSNLIPEVVPVTLIPEVVQVQVVDIVPVAEVAELSPPPVVPVVAAPPEQINMGPVLAVPVGDALDNLSLDDLRRRLNMALTPLNDINEEQL